MNLGLLNIKFVQDFGQSKYSAVLLRYPEQVIRNQL